MNHKIIYIAIIVIVTCLVLWFLVNYFISKKPQIESEIEKKLLQEGSSLYEEKKYEDAIKKYREILTRFPKAPDTDRILLLTGLSYINLNKYDESMPYFQRLADEYRQSDNAPMALYEQMVVYKSKGDFINMQTTLMTLLNRYSDKNLKVFTAAKNMEMQVLSLTLLQGAEAMLWLNNTQQALNLYQLLLKDYNPNDDTKEQILLGIGLCLKNSKNEAEALASFQKMVNDYPKSTYAPYALYHISTIYQDQKNYTKAKEYCKTILDNYSSAPQWISDRAKQCLQDNK
jgi:TolA-binding protein